MKYSSLLLLLSLTVIGGISQTGTTALPTTLSTATASKYLDLLTSKFSRLQNSIEKQTNKALQKLQKQEAKLYKQLAKKDTAAANRLFKQQQAKYAAMQEQLHNAGTAKQPLKEYLPHFDTLKSSLAFIEKASGLDPAQLQLAKNELQQFEGKMQIANTIKRQLKERKQDLQQQLEKYGMGKELMGLKKEVYYYQQQVQEFKTLLNDTKKLEQKAIVALKQSSLFKEFMKKNSLLAQLFKVPDNYGSAENLAGLQTRASVEALLNQRVASGGGGTNPRQVLQQQMQAAKKELKVLRDKVNKLGGNSSSMDMPEFKPNTQKTKSFLQRIEYGMNFQTLKSQYFMPVTTDIALTAGYKLNDKSTIGIGAAFKMGWGKDYQNVKINGQGLNLRSFVDIKIKGNYWISGGYEQNYMQEFTRYEQLQSISAWQSSGLLGLTKKYKIGKKTHQLQLLWDFLSYQQTPRAPALKFRVGYKL